MVRRVKLSFYCERGLASAVFYLVDVEALKLLFWAYVRYGWVIDGYGGDWAAAERAALDAWNGGRVLLVCGEVSGRG